jgi:DNA-binding transcriptional LysR family regulator
VELRQLTYFVAVADELNFTRAAARLRMAQPPLSQAIAKLERQLGVALFDRSSRQVALTAAGRVLLAEARDLIDRTGEIDRLVAAARDGQVWPLRVACVPSALSGVLPAVLPGFRAAHPRIRPIVRELEQQPQLEALRRGIVDVGLCRLTSAPDGLAVHRLPDDRLECALPTGHPLAGTGPVHLAELAGEDFVAFPRAAAPIAYDALTAACAAAGFSPRIAYEVDNDQALLSIVACGLAVSLVPTPTTVLRLRGVVYRPLHERYAVTPMAVARAAGEPPEAVRAFVAAVLATAPRAP